MFPSHIIIMRNEIWARSDAVLCELFLLDFSFQEIRKGLLKAAKTTGAWIFTGGTNTGTFLISLIVKTFSIQIESGSKLCLK